ncbi:MAG: Arc family DNA-binding protein [Paludibacteraceae bacterium]
MANEKENRTKNFVLRIDAKSMEAIEKWAADEFRSVNGQIQYLLDQALSKSGRKAKRNIRNQSD